MKRESRKTTTDAIAILDHMFFNTPEKIESLEKTRREMMLGMKIYELREKAGLTQKQLAERIGTQASAISRIEDADYDRHSISLLARVAEALDVRLVIDFEPKPASAKRGKAKAKTPLTKTKPKSARFRVRRAG